CPSFPAGDHIAKPQWSSVMGTTLQPSLALLGRVLVSVIFLLSGVMKIMDWSGTLDHMATQGMPASSFLLALATLAEIVGGLALLLGWQTRPAAFLLFLYLIPTTLIFHNFWAVEVARE